MLTADLVETRRRGNRLYVRKFSSEEKYRAVNIARAYIDIAENQKGFTREEFDSKCKAVDVHVRDRKLSAGLLKLILDRCVFEMNATIKPSELRKSVFVEASRVRQSSKLAGDFDRDKVLGKIAGKWDIKIKEVSDILFADLKKSHCLLSFDFIDAEDLIKLYEKSQGQAVLLKATRVTVMVKAGNVHSYRKLFWKLKFLGLLHVIYPRKNGYQIDIDGPFSLFKSVTKYGFKMALLIPTLDECSTWKLNADILWGKKKQRMEFRLKGGSDHKSDSEPVIPKLADNIAALILHFEALKTCWSVTPSTEILELPGAGLCVPDLAFISSDTGEIAYLEVMGFWSRDAVWKRVELVKAGLPYRIIFAVSTHLRVSEKVLGDDLPGSLYVYKGVMNASRIAKILDDIKS